MRVLLSCVAEDRPGFHERVETLVATLRGCGGAAAGAEVVVHMLESADEAFTARLRELDAEVAVVERLVGKGDAGSGTPNKLRMLEVARRKDFDVLIAADCDIAVAGDPTPCLVADAVTVVPADQDPLDDAQWRFLLGRLGLEDPGTPVAAGSTGSPMRPYFNSGVVAVPRALCEPLASGWHAALDEILGLWREDPAEIAGHPRFFTDQYALMAALLRGVPWRAGPRALNFPTHVGVVPMDGEPAAPALLHYHAEFDAEGFLLEPVSPLARDAADRANRARAQALGLEYGGLRRLARRERLRRWALRRRATAGRLVRRAA